MGEEGKDRQHVEAVYTHRTHGEGVIRNTGGRGTKIGAEENSTVATLGAECKRHTDCRSGHDRGRMGGRKGTD